MFHAVLSYRFQCCLWLVVGGPIWDASANDTFIPYKMGQVPQSVSALWETYDARRDPLDVEIVKEWKSEEVVTRYIIFTVGTFRGSVARIAGYYSFPLSAGRKAAFVWSHGGGQRAERNRGIYFAKQGYATLDINWLGRPLEQGIDKNTDWGAVDPTQGPRFYAKALRQQWKTNLQPDAFSIDAIASPRNANWFLLAVAARRAITFLEQQPEVDPTRIGFSGYSMGGMITALTAIDSRLKAVVPFVGGTGFKDTDFPGIEGSSLRAHFKNLDLYRKTIDASGYWPLVKCPVCFVSSSNDFHSAFDRIYQSMQLLQHGVEWRVSTNIHFNHGPGPEQWVLLNLWFDQFLKGIDQKIPPTPSSTLDITGQRARFSVMPSDPGRLVNTEIYYSYDPNARTRFWNRADADISGKTWSVNIPIYEDLPLYVFAQCRYHLDHKHELERGEAETFTLNSQEQVFMPEKVNLSSLTKLIDPAIVFENFGKGAIDWGSRNLRSIKTYKFQNPSIDRSDSKKLLLEVNPQGRHFVVRCNADSKFLGRGNDIGSFSVSRKISGDGIQEIEIAAADFEPTDPENTSALSWQKISTFEITLVDTKSHQVLDLTSDQGQSIQRAIYLID